MVHQQPSNLLFGDSTVMPGEVQTSDGKTFSISNRKKVSLIQILNLPFQGLPKQKNWLLPYQNSFFYNRQTRFLLEKHLRKHLSNHHRELPKHSINGKIIQPKAQAFNEGQRILPKHLTEVQNIQSKAKSFNRSMKCSTKGQSIQANTNSF